MERWRGAEGAGHALLSETSGRDAGMVVNEWRLLQRAVYVIDRTGALPTRTTLRT